MATMKEIRTRIKSIANIEQITKAMKMVAASNLMKVQSSVQPLKEYTARVEEMLSAIYSSGELPENAFAKVYKEELPVLYAVIVGNRGLCGSYNIALVQYLKSVLEEESRPDELIVIGKWGSEVFSNQGLDVKEIWEELSDIPTEKEIFNISEKLKQLFLEKQVGQVHLVYQSYVSALQQLPAKKQLLPFELPEDALSEDSYEEYYFEPDRQAVIDGLFEQYIDTQITAILLEARSAEHTARMTAMTNANDNIDELMQKLQVAYNRARQEAITNEISEIVGGAVALKKE